MLGRAYTPARLIGALNDLEQKYAPETLHAIGHIEILRSRPRIAIVGSRQPSTAGIDTAHHLATIIANHAGVVISGLAKGIDAVAHRAVVEAGGTTVAVLGTPLNRFYPRENRALQGQLMADQLVLSQFPEGQDVGKSGFIMRNRTMALLSDATVIIEAGEQSGTKHQGWEAIRLGRSLYLPQQLLDSTYGWPQKMLDYGAIPYVDVIELEVLLALDFLLATAMPVHEERSAAPF